MRHGEEKPDNVGSATILPHPFAFNAIGGTLSGAPAGIAIAIC